VQQEVLGSREDSLSDGDKSVLLIGGDSSDIPEWISENFKVKQVKISGNNIYDLIGNFTADVMIVLPKLTDKNTTYQAYDYAGEKSLPVLVMHYSWALLITDARDKGVDWLAEAYPFKVYIPEEVLKRKAEIKEEKRRKRTGSKTPRTLMLEEKRKRRFAEVGIGQEHKIYGRPKYIRRDPGSKCCLCDTTISYLFRLHFDVPGHEQMTQFFPVGSTCIHIWLDSLPDSEEKERIVQQVIPELERADAARKAVKSGKGKKIVKKGSTKKKPAKKAKTKKKPVRNKPARKAKTKKKTRKPVTEKKKSKAVSRKKTLTRAQSKKKKYPKIPKQRLLDFHSAESRDEEED